MQKLSGEEFEVAVPENAGAGEQLTVSVPAPAGQTAVAGSDSGSESTGGAKAVDSEQPAPVSATSPGKDAVYALQVPEGLPEGGQLEVHTAEGKPPWLSLNSSTVIASVRLLTSM